MLRYNINLHKYIIIFILFSTVFLLNKAAKATPGDLDTTFNGNGKAMLDFGGTEIGQKVAVQTDGKIVVNGYSENGVNGFLSDFLLARFNENGTLDNSFGTGGKVVTDFGETERSFGMKIQPDGKIVLVGDKLFRGTLIARYNSDGTLDTSFGNGNGYVNFAFGQESQFNDVIIQPDGKIVAVGFVRFGPNNSANVRFLIVRFNADGSFDTSFGGGNGAVYAGETDTGTYQVGTSVALQSDGKIIVGGHSSGIGAWIRINADGSPETGSNWNLEYNEIFIQGTALQPDGKILINGFSQFPPFNMTVARYNADKTIDTTFGDNGIVNTDLGLGGSVPSLSPIVLQPDGKLFVGGFVGTYPISNFVLARFNSNGTLDEGFGRNGHTIISFGRNREEAYGLALQTDGKILVSGRANNGDNDDFAIARILGDDAVVPGNVPFDFDGDGKADVSVFREGDWYILQSADNSFKTISFGQTGDLIVPADYDGDGKTDAAVFRPATADWYYLRSSDGGFVAERFGTSDSLPRPADFDGDGKADISVFNPATGNWFIKQSKTATARTINFGMNGDAPLIADFDGDNRDDIAVFRQATGNWYWLNSSDGSFNAAQFGTVGDLPAAADYDGDGKTDLAVFRPTTGTWYQLRSTQGFSAVNFGASTDTAIAADYDGDRKTDVAVFRNGAWYQLQSASDSFSAVTWGKSGDVAIPAAFLP
ncbi:MAG: FG-GAP-like repeat-containing protein [Pyrinomonadaceae bacterium]|nr:FG-GAP-like repeat-containing protein [Pyrinomonadaceae bacterium]